jgi:hypothetical protein
MNLVIKALSFGAFLFFSCSFLASASKKPALAVATNEQIDQWESEALDELASLQDPAAQKDMADLLSMHSSDQSQSTTATSQAVPALPVTATAPVPALSSPAPSNSPAIENQSAATSEQQITISLPPVQVGPIPAINSSLPVAPAPPAPLEPTAPSAVVPASGISAMAESVSSTPAVAPYEQQFIPIPDATPPAVSVTPVIPVFDVSEPAISPAPIAPATSLPVAPAADDSIMAALGDLTSEEVASEEPEEEETSPVAQVPVVEPSPIENPAPAEPVVRDAANTAPHHDRKGVVPDKASGVEQKTITPAPSTTQNKTVNAAADVVSVPAVTDKAVPPPSDIPMPDQTINSPAQTPLDESQSSLKKRVKQETVLAKKEKQTKPELLILPLDFDFAEPLLGRIYDGKNAFVIPSEEIDLIHKSGGNPTYGEITPQALRTLLTDLQLDGKDVFYGLGSGSGKEVLYVALATPAKAVGVELSETRYNMAQSAKQTIQKAHNIYLGNKVRFINKNILQVRNMKRATVVFINNLCFSDKFMEQMAQKFKSLKDGATILSIGKQLPERPFYQLKQVYNLPMTWSSSTPVYRYEVLKKTIARRPMKNCPPNVQAA